MKYNPDIHQRRSIRLKDYDYSLAGAYYVTICIQERLCLFGDIVDDEMRLNDAGMMTETALRDLPVRFERVLARELGVSPQAVYAASSQVERDGGQSRLK